MKETTDSLTIYIENIESKANEPTASNVQKVFAYSIVRQLRNLMSEVSNLSNHNNPGSNYMPIFSEIINRFKQLIEIFYRQFSMLPEIVTTEENGVELVAHCTAHCINSPNHIDHLMD